MTRASFLPPLLTLLTSLIPFASLVLGRLLGPDCCHLPRLLGSFVEPAERGDGGVDFGFLGGQKYLVGGLKDGSVGGGIELPVCDGGADGCGQLEDPQRIHGLGAATPGKFWCFVTNVIN